MRTASFHGRSCSFLNTWYVPVHVTYAVSTRRCVTNMSSIDKKQMVNGETAKYTDCEVQSQIGTKHPISIPKQKSERQRAEK